MKPLRMKKLMTKDGLVSIHHKNIQAIAVEIFKRKNGMSREIVSDRFLTRTGLLFKDDFIQTV